MDPIPTGRYYVTMMLERGSPHEIEPERRAVWKAAATKYTERDQSKHPPEAVARVRGVWLEGKVLPSWQEIKKMPNMRDQITVLKPIAPRHTPEEEQAWLEEKTAEQETLFG